MLRFKISFSGPGSSALLQNYINKDENLARVNHGNTPTDLNEARLSPPTQNVQTQI